MKALHERHEKVVTRAFNKKLAVTKQAAKLRAVHEEKQHKLAQGYGGYGGYGGSGGYGGYGGYGGAMATTTTTEMRLRPLRRKSKKA